MYADICNSCNVRNNLSREVSCVQVFLFPDGDFRATFGMDLNVPMKTCVAGIVSSLVL